MDWMFGGLAETSLGLCSSSAKNPLKLSHTEIGNNQPTK